MVRLKACGHGCSSRAVLRSDVRKHKPPGLMWDWGRRRCAAHLPNFVSLPAMDSRAHRQRLQQDYYKLLHQAASVRAELADLVAKEPKDSDLQLYYGEGCIFSGACCAACAARTALRALHCAQCATSMRYLNTERHIAVRALDAVSVLELELGRPIDKLEVYKDEEHAEAYKRVGGADNCGGVPYFFNARTKQHICGLADLARIREWAGLPTQRQADE